ncbi:MAG: PQQ-like beta-propeller repeat protein [Nitrospira sp.]|nr:PQQ-like beta-propeller repeat protein [Nitrospira sp.]
MSFDLISRLSVLAGLSFGAASAADWPQWMGPERDGVWRETGIVERFDTNGPPVLWRVPVKAGYVGPAVADGKVYFLDRQAGPPAERKKGERALPQVPGNERVVCLDATTGRMLWENVYDCPYQIAYPSGPRATPVVDAGRVFTLGAMGDVRCLDAQDGRVLWSRRLPTEYQVEPPVWGYAVHPLLDGERLICAVGGTNTALVAFHRDSGKELWRALTAHEIGYAPPVLREVAGRRQLVFWHPDALSGLDPVTGTVLWTQPYPVGGKPQRPEVAIAMPRFDGDRVLLTSFYQGSMLVQIPRQGEEPRVVWNRRSSKQSEMTDGLHTVMSTPVLRDGFAFGLCAFGELRCLDLRTGDRKWESLDLFGGESGFFAHAFIIEQGDRYWFWNDHGELAVGTMSATGLRLTSKAKLLDTTESTRGREVLWCHPAFAHRRAYMHNGREMICVDLAAQRS